MNRPRKHRGRFVRRTLDSDCEERAGNRSALALAHRLVGAVHDLPVDKLPAPRERHRAAAYPAHRQGDAQKMFAVKMPDGRPITGWLRHRRYACGDRQSNHQPKDSRHCIHLVCHASHLTVNSSVYGSSPILSRSSGSGPHELPPSPLLFAQMPKYVESLGGSSAGCAYFTSVSGE